METLGYSGGVKGVLRIEEKGGERVLKVYQWYTWPGADLGLHKRHYTEMSIYRAFWCALHGTMPPPLPEMQSTEMPGLPR